MKSYTNVFRVKEVRTYMDGKKELFCLFYPDGDVQVRDLEDFEATLDQGYTVYLKKEQVDDLVEQRHTKYMKIPMPYTLIVQEQIGGEWIDESIVKSIAGMVAL